MPIATRRLVLATSLFGLLATAMLIAASPAAVHARFERGPLELSAELTRSKLAAGGDGGFVLALTLTAPAAPTDVASPITDDTAELLPTPPHGVDFMVVLDRSGSMRGLKLQDAQAALGLLIRHLAPHDRLGLVSYADGVASHSIPLHATPSNKRLLTRMVHGVVAGGNTNLGAGLDVGLQLLGRFTPGEAPPCHGDCPESFPSPRRSAKLLLVSDGLANRGVTDPHMLAAMAQSAAASGVAVTAVGVGLDFDERLMTRLADAGGGGYYFIQEPQAFADLFLHELQRTRRIAAHGVTIELTLPPRVTLRDAAGYTIRQEGSTYSFLAGELAAGEKRTLHLALEASTAEEARFALDKLAVRYDHDGAVRTQNLTTPLAMAVVKDAAEATASIKRDAWERKVLQEDYGRLREDVAEAVAAGDEGAARAKIEAYRQQTAAQNQAVGSAAVNRNLEEDVTELEDALGAAFAPAPAAEAEVLRKQTSKTLQYEGYQSRRAKEQPAP